MIELVDITHHYGVRPVLRGLSVEIRAGELVSVLGPNGMGKSTLLRVMAGIMPPLKGRVAIDGVVRRSTPEAELAIRRRVVYLPDHPWLPMSRTAREYLLAVGRLYGIGDDRLFEHVDRLLDLFNLVDQGNWAIKSLSSGQQKKAAICSALVAEAPIMLLDEPFAGGVDPAGILALKKVLHRLHAKQGATIVMATPSPELVEELSDRVLVLRDGEIVAFDSPAGLRALARCEGSLAEVLEVLVHSETLESLSRYFEERP